MKQQLLVSVVKCSTRLFDIYGDVFFSLLYDILSTVLF